MSYSFENVLGKHLFGRLVGAAVRAYVTDRGGELTIDTTLMPGG